MPKKKSVKSGRERRRFKRYPLKASVSFRILTLPSPRKMLSMIDADRRGKMRDISTGGICFHSPHLLLPGTVIRFELPRTPAGKAANRRARVVWTREIRPGDFRVGVKFA